MAYLVEYGRRCDVCTHRLATKVLRNRYNADLGWYCATCGKRRLKEQEQKEQEGSG